jgi:hypothetical protein
MNRREYKSLSWLRDMGINWEKGKEIKRPNSQILAS